MVLRGGGGGGGKGDVGRRLGGEGVFSKGGPLNPGQKESEAESDYYHIRTYVL